MLQYTPKVSIVIPAYNADNYLAEAIESALAQSYPNVEIIVVNDGSRDDGATAAVAAQYAGKIRYFEKENGGSSSALNCGIRNMTGEWFSWLSHDDLYEPEKLEKQIRCLNELGLPETALRNHVVFSGTDCIDADGNTLMRASVDHMRAISEKVKTMSGNEYLVAEPTYGYFYGCTCLIHKCVFEKIGAFNENLRLLNDVDMWYRIYTAGYVVHYYPEALVKLRVHAKQISRSIGFSYQNPEQDRFWADALQWLEENHRDNPELFFLFGRNAYKKTRDAEGDRAFAILQELKPEQKMSLQLRKHYYQLYARLRTMAKQIVLKLRT